MKMQIHQLVDACLFAISFWLAYELRSSRFIIDLFHLQPFDAPFESFVWLYVILIPAAPLVLEAGATAVAVAAAIFSAADPAAEFLRWRERLADF